MSIDLNLSTVLSGLILTGVIGIFGQLYRLNGRMVKIEQWRDDHQNQNDERHRDNQDAIRELKKAINGSCHYPDCPGTERR